MKSLLCSVAALLLTASVFAAESPVDWREAIGKSLSDKMTVNWDSKKADQALALVSKASGVTITVDKAVTGILSSTDVSLNVADTAIKDILGAVLKTAGLRYTLRDGGLFVSTPQRLVTLLLSGDKDTEVAEAEPMTEAEAIAITNEADVASDVPDLSNPWEAIGFEPWKKPLKEYRDPVTGVMQFPAPDVWVESENKGNPRFYFSDRPSFLIPEKLWELVYANGSDAGAKHELLGRVSKMIKDHPEWTEDEVLKQLLLISQTPAPKK